jgi:hypothetical protein
MDGARRAYVRQLVDQWHDESDGVFWGVMEEYGVDVSEIVDVLGVRNPAPLPRRRRPQRTRLRHKRMSETQRAAFDAFAATWLVKANRNTRKQARKRRITQLAAYLHYVGGPLDFATLTDHQCALVHDFVAAHAERAGGAS